MEKGQGSDMPAQAAELLALTGASSFFILFLDFFCVCETITVYTNLQYAFGVEWTKLLQQF